MALVLAPDAEKVVSDYLRTLDEMVALGARVRGSHPDDTSSPWVRVLQLGGPQNDPPYHLIEVYFQFDCYAGKLGGQREAVTLARTVSAAIAHISEGSHSEAVVTRGQINGVTREPDRDLSDGDGHARERVIITGSVWLHAIP